MSRHLMAAVVALVVRMIMLGTANELEVWSQHCLTGSTYSSRVLFEKARQVDGTLQVVSDFSFAWKVYGRR